MFSKILSITIKDLKILLKDRGGIVLLFLMPIMFIFVMSSAMSSAYEISEDEPMEILVVNLDQGELALEAILEIDEVEGFAVIPHIDDVELTFDMADRLVAEDGYQIAVVFPEDFSEQVFAAVQETDSDAAIVTFIVDPATSEQFLMPVRGAVQGFIYQVAAYSQMPLQLAAGFDILAEEVPAEQAPFVQMIGDLFVEEIEGGGLSETSTGVEFEQVTPSSFTVQEFPDAVEQNVPGYTLFGVFFIVQVLAMNILEEKEEGTFRRLLVAPIPKWAMLLGKLLPYYLVNLLQVVAMFSIGVFAFDMSLGHAPFALVIITLATAGAATGLGLLVAALGKTREQIGGLSTLLVLTLAAIGGMMVPSFVMPPFMQQLAKISPHSWALAGYQDVIVRGLGVEAVLPEVAVLMGFALVFFSIATWRFKFE